MALIGLFGGSVGATECTYPGPTGAGCSGCRSTAHIVTKTFNYMWFDINTGTWILIPVNVDYRMWKMCNDQSMDEGPKPATSSALPNSPEYQDNGIVNCAAGASLFFVALGQSFGCTGTPVAAGDPDLAGLDAAMTGCGTFTRSDGNLNWIPATKDCATGQPWPPVMPPMPHGSP